MKSCKLFGATLALAAGLASPALAQTPAAPVTGVPDHDQAVAASCTENELTAAEDLVSQVPESLRSSAQVILQQATELQNDNNSDLCAQKLDELRVLAQSGASGTAAVAAGAPVVSPGSVAASCTENELTRVSSMIADAPESRQAALRQKLQAADAFQNDNDLEMCASTLAEIEAGIQGQTQPVADASPGVALAPEGLPVAASECTETSLAAVSDQIAEAPEGIQPELRQHLQRANEYQNDNNLQQCAQTLAQIRDIIETGTSGTVGSSR